MTSTEQLDEIIAMTMIREMFAPHELPVDNELWQIYLHTAAAIRDAIRPLAAIVPRECTTEMAYAASDKIAGFFTDAQFITAAIAAGDITQECNK